jgi:hypothetical protein
MPAPEQKLIDDAILDVINGTIEIDLARVVMNRHSTKEQRLEEYRRRALRAIDHANALHGDQDEIAGLRDALLALPDRTLLSRLPGDVRVFIETQLALIEGD